MMPDMAKRAKRKISFGCLFWLAFILLISALFFLNKDTISFVLDKTNAKSIFFKDTPENIDKPSESLPDIQSQEDAASVKGDGSEEPEREATVGKIIPLPSQPAGKPNAASEKSEQDISAAQRNRQSGEPVSRNDERAAGGNAVPETAQSPAATRASDRPVPQSAQPVQQSSGSAAASQYAAAPQTKPESNKPQPPATRKTVLYWIRVAADGKLIPTAAVRVLPKSDAPMSDALEVLFAAPTVEELKQGVRTLIPAGTKLRSAWVKNNVAFINVSEEFQFNQYGIDGALAQLSQVVFTATEFSTVKSVQFLIEGQKKDYLGAEGVWIGSPLSRTSF